MYIEAYLGEELAECRTEPGIASPVYLFPFPKGGKSEDLLANLGRKMKDAEYRLKGRIDKRDSIPGVVVHPIASSHWGAKTKMILARIGSAFLLEGDCLIFAPHEAGWQEHFSVQSIDDVCRDYYFCGQHMRRFVEYIH